MQLGDIHAFMQKATELENALKENNYSQKEGQNRITVTVTGGGGIAIGVALGMCIGVSVVVAAWVGTELGDQRDTNKNQDAYINAIYQAAPHLPKPDTTVSQPQEP